VLSTLPQLLSAFATDSTQDASYFLCNQRDMVRLAAAIHNIHPLTLQERFTLCKAPVNQASKPIMDAFLSFVTR